MTAATARRIRPLTIASRGSALALAQSGQIGAQLERALGVRVTVLEVVSQGDVDPRELTRIGGAGVFVSALRAALQHGSADLAVHSLKDLPTAPSPDLTLAAVPPREDPSDVLISAGSVSLDALPPGARVGTGSPRRAAQLAALRPDLEIVPVRGNVDTRIAKVRSGELDGVVLARAGLARLGRLSDVAQTFTPNEMLPAPGQGALALECRADDGELADTLREALDDASTRSCVEAERAVLAGLEAGCSAPVGALAEVAADTMTLTAAVGNVLRCSASAPYNKADSRTGELLGAHVARELLARGAADVVLVSTDLYDPGTGGTGPSMEMD